jgi:menaquinol-cytochrome c reductase iron-sulfur subunit
MAVFKRRPKQLTLPGVSARRERVAKPPARHGAFRRLRNSLFEVPMTRRRFLEGTLGWVTAAIAAALGIPAAIAWVSPALRKQTGGWSPIGRLKDPGPDEPDLSPVSVPIEAHFTQFIQDAYLEAQPQDVAVYVVNHGDGKFSIFDDRCTHLGCPFRWDEESGQFVCPCHNGVFDAEGRVLGGPPPRPLDRYEFKVENGILYAGELFKVNDQLQRITQ